MYSVDKFVEETSRESNTAVNAEAIAEIIEAREAAKSEIAVEATTDLDAYEKILHPVLSEDELLNELKTFLSSHPSDDGSVGLRYFVVNYLGSQNYEINHSYGKLNSLDEKGLVEIFKREKNGIQVSYVRLLTGATGTFKSNL